MSPEPVRTPEGPLTIAQLAALAGVSTATVSKVVNGRSDVPAATREQIEGLIRVRGYRRQRRPTKSAALIEVLFHELRGLYAIEILGGVQEVAREHRVGVVLSEMGGRHVPGHDLGLGGADRHPPPFQCPAAEQTNSQPRLWTSNSEQVFLS